MIKLVYIYRYEGYGLILARSGGLAETRRVCRVTANAKYFISSIGPAALDMAWVGAGSADAFFHFGIHCWDMAAGSSS
jgi:fructose-1,6-bisphosphatase/inositol monophosphatase family enzyme